MIRSSSLCSGVHELSRRISLCSAPGYRFVLLHHHHLRLSVDCLRMSDRPTNERSSLDAKRTLLEINEPSVTSKF